MTYLVIGAPRTEQEISAHDCLQSTRRMIDEPNPLTCLVSCAN